MLSRTTPSRGVTLIELVVTMAVLCLLLLAAVPSFGSWVVDSRVRSTAESMQNGLRLALAEAVQRNRVSVFALTTVDPAPEAAPARNGRNWYVGLLPLPGSDEHAGDAQAGSRFVQGSNHGQQAGVTVEGPALLCFGPLGQQVALDSGATGLAAACSTANPIVYRVSAPAGGTRPLQVQVYLGGRVRLCDPARTLSSENPDGC